MIALEQRDEKTNTILILFVILLAAASLRLYCFRGFVGTDDAEYAKIAFQIANGSFKLEDYKGPPVFPLRTGIVLPTALVFKLFGVSTITLIVYPYVLSLAGVLLIYICTTRLFNRLAGIIAAGIWTVSPIEFWNATRLFPNLPGAVFGMCGITVLILLDDLNENNRLVGFAGGLAAGVCFGLSWLCTENVVYLVPFCLIYMAIDLKRNFNSKLFVWGGVAAGALGLFVSELAVYYTITGDWLFRFHEIERNYSQIENGFFKEGSSFGWSAGESYHRALLKRLVVTGPQAIFLSHLFLYTPIIAAIGSFHAFLWKRKNFLLPVLWMGTLVFMFNFSSSSLKSYMPLAIFYRYFYPIFFPAVIITGGFISELFGRNPGQYSKDALKEKRFWGASLLSIVCLLSCWYLFQYIRTGPSKWAIEVNTISNLLRPTDAIYTDTLSIRGLEFFWGYPDKMNTVDFENMLAADSVPAGSYVFTNRNYINWLNDNAGMWLSDSAGYRVPSFFGNPPTTWRTVWKNHNATLYRAGSPLTQQ